MQKSRILATAVMLGLMIVSGLTACTKENNVTEAVSYEVCIPAANGGDDQTRAVTIDGTTSTSIFTTGEWVYVYNETTNAMLGGCLSPANLSEGGTKCDLVGSLTGTISQGDQLVLLYNLNMLDPYDVLMSGFEYRDQNGLATGVIDGAMATVTATLYESNKLSATETAEFENQQSIFRFKFVDENNTPITVADLSIYSDNRSVAISFLPIYHGLYCSASSVSPLTVTPSSPTSDYLYVAIGIDESASSGDVINFIAIDDNGDEYRGTKAAPSSGFRNGKYYYNSTPIQLTKMNYVKPTITWTSVQNGTPVEPVNRRYSVYGQGGNPSVITISGNSNGYDFYLAGGSTVTLSNLTATVETSFIYSNADLSIVVDGVNSITCTDYHLALMTGSSIKLSGNGTLTLTAKNDFFCGMGASNYDPDNGTNQYSSTGVTDITGSLAAPGYKVTRSAITNIGNGTYTWTYTVTPINYGRADYTGSEWQ